MASVLDEQVELIKAQVGPKCACDLRAFGWRGFGSGGKRSCIGRWAIGFIACSSITACFVTKKAIA